jgi:hypothetical protein
VSEARRLKEIESEKATLDRLLADAMLDQSAFLRRLTMPNPDEKLRDLATDPL